MRARSIWIGVLAAALLLPLSAFAQEAVIRGTVSDGTGAVLPGAVVRAVHEASGNNFEVVSDGAGAFRLPVRVGFYTLTAELSGFTTITRRVELLAGQEVALNLQLSVSTLQETVTVTAEAPLVETTSSTVSGNVDPRQMTELPVNGRNWQDVIAIVPGARYNSQRRGDSIAAGTGTMQLNIDGQQVTQTISAGDTLTFGQPRFSQDAIAEVEFVSNRFDASQGRSMGVQVNAITKSGTNTLAGTLSGFFRNDSLNAADHVVGRVLPYSNQQLSATFGGPILRNRLHFFFSYEYEREPYTTVYSTPVAAFNTPLAEKRTEPKALARVDAQFSPQTRLAVRGSMADPFVPSETLAGGLANSTPNGRITNDQRSRQLQATLTRVLSNWGVNETRFGFNHYSWVRYTQTRFDPNTFLSRWVPEYEKQFASVMAPRPLTVNPTISFRGLTNGGSGQPQNLNQEDFSLRNDFTVNFSARGNHALHSGGEVLKTHNWGYVCQGCVGGINAQDGPLPTNMTQIFPDLYDVSTWNLDLISPIVRSFSASIGNTNQDWPRDSVAFWVQDDWTVTPRLTLNLGVRYDLAIKAHLNDVAIPPFLPGGRSDDTNNWAPRFGFAYSLTPDTVIRGGAGKFYSEIASVGRFFLRLAAESVNVTILNDGRPDFASNPYNGIAPTTFEEALRYVQRSGAQRSLNLNVANPAITPFSYQTSIGVQHQLNARTGVQADYVFTGIRDDLRGRNLNLAYNPATGVNYPNTDRSRLPYPEFSTVTLQFPDGYSNYHALQTAVTKRLSDNWQASATYTLSWFYDGYKSPAPDVPNLAEDLGPQYGLGASDQRHRAVFNGIWQLPYDFQLSGVYFFGSGERLATTCGCALRRGAGDDRLLPDGTLVPRNSFVGDPIHRVDVRLLKRLAIGPRVRVEGMLDIFNAFNHANFGSYTTQTSNPNFGRPIQSTLLSYAPRMVQVGFRVAF